MRCVRIHLCPNTWTTTTVWLGEFIKFRYNTVSCSMSSINDEVLSQSKRKKAKDENEKKNSVKYSLVVHIDMFTCVYIHIVYNSKMCTQALYALHRSQNISHRRLMLTHAHSHTCTRTQTHRHRHTYYVDAHVANTFASSLFDSRAMHTLFLSR